MKMLLQWERSSETMGSRFLQVFTTVFMSCRLVLRPRFAGCRPRLIWAASWSSMICCAAWQRPRKMDRVRLNDMDRQRERDLEKRERSLI